jgi:hypothetical protein
MNYDKELGFGTAQLGQSVSLIRSLNESGTSSVEMPGVSPVPKKQITNFYKRSQLIFVDYPMTN